MFLVDGEQAASPGGCQAESDLLGEAGCRRHKGRMGVSSPAQENVRDSRGSDPSALSTQRSVCGNQPCSASWTWLTPLSPYFLLCEVKTILRPPPPGAGAEEAPGRHRGPLLPPSLLPQIPKDKKILVM